MTIDHATREPADPPLPVYTNDKSCCEFFAGGVVDGLYRDFYFCPGSRHLSVRWDDDGPCYNSVSMDYGLSDLHRIVHSFDGLLDAYKSAVRLDVIENVLAIDSGVNHE